MLVEQVFFLVLYCDKCMLVEQVFFLVLYCDKCKVEVVEQVVASLPSDLVAILHQ
jgi:hypothetical protein